MKTSSTKSFLIPGLVFGLFVAIGWFVFNTSYDHSSQPDASSKRFARTRTTSDAMSNLRSQRSEPDRLRSTIALALSIPSSELNTWLTQGKFSYRQGYSSQLFQQIILERLSREDPAAFLAWLRKNGGSQFTPQLSALCENHPELLHQAFSDAKDMNEKGRLLHLVTFADPDQALTALKNLIPLRGHSAYLDIALHDLAKKRPNELEALLDKSDAFQNFALVAAVYELKLAQDFDLAFDELCALPHGLTALIPHNHNRKLFESEQLLARLSDAPQSWRNELARNPYILAKALANHTPALGLDWETYGFSKEEAHNIRYALFRNQASRNPVEVFQQLQHHPFPNEEKSYIFKSFLTSDPSPETLAELSQLLSNPEDRALFQQQIEARQNPSPLPATPDKILTSLEQNKLVNLSQHLNRLKPEQREEIISRFPSLDEDQKTQLATLVAKEQNKVPLALQQQAIEHLLNNPDSHQLSGWTQNDNSKAIEKASRLALDLMTSDSENAARWVDSLPDTSTRLQTKINLALNWNRLDPESAQRWIATQNPTDQTEIKLALKNALNFN